MRKIFKSTLSLAAAAAMVAGAVVAPSLVSAWGDNSEGGRRSYTIDQINHGVLGDKIVFNSISDSYIGDEKNFVGARQVGDTGYWNGNDITVQDGQEYVIRLYVHNNSPLGRNAISRNTRVAFDIPTESSTQVQVNGFIYSDNATPSKYWDYVNFNSDQAFHLEYVYGSALIENNGFASKANGGAKSLSDAIVTQAASNHGVLIGYDRLDGNVPGCFEFDNYITIRVKAVYDHSYYIDNQVRLAGTGASGWGNNANVKVGDTVDFQIQYINKSTDGEVQRNVMIKALMPKNLQYIPGTTKIWNSNFNGATYNQDDITTKGINIGDYAPQANAYIRFSAKVVDNSLGCGSNTLVMWTQGTVGQKVIQDYSTMMLNNVCTTPDPVAQEYHVRVNYVYEDGTTAAPAYDGIFLEGDPFKVTSPVIKGYTADKISVSGTVGKRDLSYTVTYVKDIVVPEVKEHHVRIKYVYEDGTTAAPTYDGIYQEGKTFEITSPELDGYSADQTLISGMMAQSDLSYTVTYTKNAENPAQDPSDYPEKPEESKVPVVNLPNTGPEAITGSIIAAGALATSAGYYAASRKAMRKIRK